MTIKCVLMLAREKQLDKFKKTLNTLSVCLSKYLGTYKYNHFIFEI